MNTFHQPLAAMSSGARRLDSSSPIVGTSQKSPTTMRNTRSTPPLTAPARRDPSDSLAFIAAPPAAAVAR